jgi:hypothetical protein
LVVDSAWTKAHADQVRRAVQDYFAAPVRVDIEICERLSLPSSGKFQNMVIEVA